MSTPTPMTPRDAGVPIGEIMDYGPGRVLAISFTSAGKRESLGFHPTRRDAIRAARQRAGPPKAA